MSGLRGCQGRSFDALLDDIGRRRVLSPDEEKNLAHLLVAARSDLWCALLDYPTRTSGVVDAARQAGITAECDDRCDAVISAADRWIGGSCGDVEFAIACRRASDALALTKGITVARGLVASSANDRGLSSSRNAHADLLVALLRRHDDFRDRFVTANMRLVVSVACRLRSWVRLPLVDMVQEGALGLVRAVDTFDPARGFKLSTYATWWIRHMIVRGANDRGRLVRVPQHIHDRRRELVLAGKAILKRTGVWPGVEEIAAEAGVTLEHAMVVYDAFGGSLHALEDSVSSLEVPSFLQDGEVSNPIAFPPIDRDDDPDEVVDAIVGVEEMLRLMESDLLDDRDRMILRARAGLDTGVKLRLDEIGLSLGLSRERVRQLEAKAIAKLRKAMAPRVREMAA